MVCVKFFVPGVPVPQGSMSVFNGRVVHSNSHKLRAWRGAIRAAVTEPITEQPVALGLCFVLPKPKTVRRPVPSVKPDLDKLVRAVGDALEGTAYRNDSQIVSVVAEKVYGRDTGVFITISQVYADA